jgi:hypothetical protein
MVVFQTIDFTSLSVFHQALCCSSSNNQTKDWPKTSRRSIRLLVGKHSKAEPQTNDKNQS